MKIVKGISLFFIYPLVMLGIGFGLGIYTMDFFYPGDIAAEQVQESAEISVQTYEETEAMPEYATPVTKESEKEITDVAAVKETLNADTEYVLQEADLVRNTMVETTSRVPDEYLGLTREQFLESMEDYEAYPPLSELERGFVSLEVLAFSTERVVVQTNYMYIQPSESFYLSVLDNEVVALLEDKETVYINTGILLDSLPDEVQLEIIQMLFIENEESLYNFLEHYSS